MNNFLNKLFVIVPLLSQLWTYSQEVITTNYDSGWTDVNVEQRQLLNDNNPCYFTYLVDTIELPFIDDFSTNLQRQFNAKTSDPGVTDTLFYYLMKNGYPLNDTVAYVTQITFHFNVDTVAGDTVMTLVDTLIPDTILVCDLCSYPMSCVSTIVYPPFDLIDTVWNGNFDTIHYTADYLQDSLRRYFVQDDGKSLWTDRYASVNNSFAIYPPTVGVATMDALDEDGYPYEFVNVTLHGVADYLTSYPINLGIDPGTSLPYGPSDSIYLSFFYQPQGNGNKPEISDSLVLQFWSPINSEWYSVWRVAGEAVTNFKNVYVPIDDAKYFSKGFQFRFENYATLSGALDHWNIDYVRLYKNRTVTDTIIDDMTFQYPSYSLIKDYTAMDWQHFSTNPSSFMRDTVTTFQFNLSNVDKLLSNGLNIDLQGANINNYTHPNVPNAIAGMPITTLHKINGDYNFVYDTALADTCITFQVKFWNSATPDAHRQNDTIVYNQEFCNYYSYDDGSAEVGYGLVATGAKLAYKFTIPVQDTLRGVRMSWLPVGYDMSGDPFFLTIWDDDGVGGKPGTILSQNATFSKPVYGVGKDGFVWYGLDDSSGVSVSGSFYVGWQQTSNARLNIGMDVNIDNSSKIFYNTGTSWSGTSFKGSLLMRPVFSGNRYYLEVDVPDNSSSFDFNIYPNPASGIITISPIDNNNVIDVQMLDIGGRLVGAYTVNGSTQIDVSKIPNGMYFMNLKDRILNISSTQKIVIQK